MQDRPEWNFRGRKSGDIYLLNVPGYFSSVLCALARFPSWPQAPQPLAFLGDVDQCAVARRPASFRHLFHYGSLDQRSHHVVPRH